jgi:protein PhnA
MTTTPPCPKCAETYAYEDRGLWNCPSCGHEWKAGDEDSSASADASARQVRDANGVVLNYGDTVTVIKDLKFRGGVVKVGTKVKGIRLIPGASDGHDIDCKIPGIGEMALKSGFVKKIAE